MVAADAGISLTFRSIVRCIWGGILLGCVSVSVLGCAAASMAEGVSTMKTAEEVEMISTKRIVPMPARWVYWLQHPKPVLIAASDSNYAVVDYSADGTDEKAFTVDDVGLMQAGGRKVLCYFSIGEAERYRFYWQPEWDDNPPDFLGPENPDWEGNFKVKYWHPDWWETVLQPYMDKIFSAGFDGVYLDIVDAYWFWHEEGRKLEKSSSDMIRLVSRIASYSRERWGKNIIICPQNALGILEDAPQKMVAQYLRTIDMVGVESLLYNTTEDMQVYRIDLLKRFSKAGKYIVGVEYLDEEQFMQAKERAAGLPFPYVLYLSTSDAALDKLVKQP